MVEQDDFFYPLPWVVRTDDSENTAEPDTLQILRERNNGTETPASKQERQPRLKLAGRIGQIVFPERSKNPIARFSVAVPVEGQDKPTWYRCYTTGARAERLRGTIEQGMLVELEGYLQRTVTQKDGKPVEKREVYALYVRTGQRSAP